MANGRKESTVLPVDRSMGVQTLSTGRRGLGGFGGGIKDLRPIVRQGVGGQA